MKVFSCQSCGQFLYFENVHCECCGRSLGYLPDEGMISALEPLTDTEWTALGAAGKQYRFCKNCEYGVCNWMVPADADFLFCTACRHNHTIPDLTVPGHLELWRKLETAKHRLFYTLMDLHLPLRNRADDTEHGLAFDFVTEGPEIRPVITGHNNGIITLALKEADDAEREHIRTTMSEPYRTLLGHFRHESGHYYWDLLVRDGGRLDAFRAAFGQEEQDYAASLQQHYANGPPGDWQRNFVSAYASAHPWEDFAETWAHYLHIVDTLETARSFGVRVQVRLDCPTRLKAVINFDPYDAADIDQLIDAWLPLSFALNNLNRSMGQADLYPFVLAPSAIGKLGFVHDLIHDASASHAARSDRSLDEVTPAAQPANA